jgi:hypothetical protein
MALRGTWLLDSSRPGLLILEGSERDRPSKAPGFSANLTRGRQVTLRVVSGSAWLRRGPIAVQANVKIGTLSPLIAGADPTRWS